MKVGIKLTLKEIQAVNTALLIAYTILDGDSEIQKKRRETINKLLPKFKKLYQKGYKHIDKVK